MSTRLNNRLLDDIGEHLIEVEGTQERATHYALVATADLMYVMDLCPETRPLGRKLMRDQLAAIVDAMTLGGESIAVCRNALRELRGAQEPAKRAAEPA